MKISQKQANLLAKQIQATLLKSKVNKISPLKRKELQEFYEQRKELVDACKAADEARQKHDNQFFNLIGRKPNIYVGNGLQSTIDKIEAVATPSVSDIEDKIILKSMFATEGDMQKFMDTIIKDYTKTNKIVVAN